MSEPDTARRTPATLPPSEPVVGGGGAGGLDDTRPAAPPPPFPAPTLWRRTTRAVNQYAGVLVVLVATILIFSVSNDRFLTTSNVLNILQTNAVLLVVAIGLTFVLLVGGIDLSLGGTMALSAVGLWALITQGVPAPLAAVIVVIGAFVLGAVVNGLLIGWVGLSFLVVTIGTASVYRGIAQLSTGGRSESLFTEPWLIQLGSGRVLGVPLLVLISLAVFVVGVLVLRYTGYGRMVYAVGGNPEAARLAGMPVVTIRVSVFSIAAGLAAIGAVMSVARLTAADPNTAGTVGGVGIELTAGAAVLLGGTSFMGGRGTLLGTLLGVLFLGVLTNGLTLLGISSFWGAIVSGTVLIAAIFVDRLRTGRAMP